ncbi:hypothetical protein [Nitrosospira briensis]|uniref:hypothetical protein n=1 Tax=Nitrosospira briensis TaxID=35799 RepID=UPI000AD200E8|nr:hypothetical protein [Nitrosospira briensis]
MKSLINDCDRKESVAIGIAIKAGVLQACGFHEGIIFEGNEIDIERAYRLGNAEFTNGMLGDLFSSRREMTDFIKSVVEDNNGTSKCFVCAKMLADD